MKKRIITFLLAMGMVIGTLSGCAKTDDKTGGSSTGGTGSTGGDKAGTTGTEWGPKVHDDVKLKMLICWNGGFKVAEDQYNNEVATAIREKTGVTVEFEGIMMSETEKLNMMFASGDMPDIINSPYWGGNAGETQVVKKAGAEGRLLDIKEALPNYPNIAHAYDIGVISQPYLDNDLDIPEFNGARYILPQETPGNVESISNWLYGVFVRGDVPEALGIDPLSIKTQDQLMDFMTKARDHGFKDVNGNKTITATTYHEGWDYSRFTEGYSEKRLTAYSLQPDGKVLHDDLTDMFLDRNMFIWKMVNDNILDKESFKHSDAQADEKVGNGTALFVACQFGPINRATKLTGLYTQHPEMNYVPVGPLNYKGGEALTQNETQGRSGSPAIMFPTSCKDLGAALTWIDFLNSKEGMTLAEYGIEGDTYTLNAEGQPRWNKEIIDRKNAADPKIDQELRNKGITYMVGRTICGDKKMSWFGEGGAGASESSVPAEVAYKALRPAEVIPGYPVDKLATSFPEYARAAAVAFEGTKAKDYKERAFFAATEAEAKKILEEYQTYLKTQDGGIFMEFLDYVGEQAKSRDDAAF